MVADLANVLFNEVTKTVTASVVTGGIAGAKKVARLVLGRLRHVPADRDTLRAELERLAAEDPGWWAEVVAAMEASTAGSPPLDVAAPREFFDRDDLRELELSAGVFGFSGRHGSGKTALVRQLAADKAAAFPHGVVALDLDDWRDGGVLPVSELQREALARLGVTDLAEGRLTEQYRAATARRRFVLVLDNVLGAAELRALLPTSPECLVLATTRRLDTELRAEATWRELAPLDREGARRLLASRAGGDTVATEPDAADALLVLCDAMPEPLRRVGALLARRRGEDAIVASLVAALRAAGGTGADPSGVVAQCAALTVDALPPGLAADVALLATHPGFDLTRASATALLGGPAGETIDALLDRGLLTRTWPGRYRLSPLDGAYARRIAGDPERADAGFDRLLADYARRAAATDHAAEGPDRLRCYPPLPEPPTEPPTAAAEPVDRWDTEQHTVLPLVAEGFRRGRHEDVSRVCGALEVWFTRRGHHHRYAAILEWGVRSAEALGDGRLVARTHQMTGRVATLLGELDRAGTELVIAQREAETTDDLVLRSSVAESWATLHRVRAERRLAPDLDPAIRALRYAIDLDLAAGPARAVGIHRWMLANVLVLHLARLDPATTLVDVHELLDAADADLRSDVRNLSRVHTVRAKAHVAAGRLADARAEVAFARDLAARANATQYDAELSDIDAEIARGDGDVARAREIWAGLYERFHASAHPAEERYLEKLSGLPR